MSPKIRRRALAVPFVMTLAACGGAKDEGVHANPPPQPTSTTPVATATTPPPAASKVRKAADGTCWEDPTDFKCPPPEVATCNPPPPRKVDCPK